MTVPMMDESFKAKYEAEMVEWIRNSLENKPAIAATLTFERTKNGGSISENYGNKTICEYGKRLHREAFGQISKPKRGGQCISFVPIAEGGGDTGKELHYHAVIEVPDGVEASEWADTCADLWVKLKAASKCHNTFREVKNDGWFEYLAKQRTKANPLDYLVLDALQLSHDRTKH